MEKLTWTKFIAIASNPIEYMGSGPVTTESEAETLADNFNGSAFNPNRVLTRETSRDLVFSTSRGESWLPKKGKVMKYKNFIFIMGTDCTVAYRTN